MRLAGIVLLSETRRTEILVAYAKLSLPPIYCCILYFVRLAGIEPAHPAPEAGALSFGPQAQNLYRSEQVHLTVVFFLFFPFAEQRDLSVFSVKPRFYLDFPFSHSDYAVRYLPGETSQEVFLRRS